MASISLVCFPSLLPRLNTNLSSNSNLNSNHLVIRKNFSYSSSNLKLRKDFNGVFTCSTTSGKEVIGGKTEIKDVTTNKEVQELGKFAVEEFNRNYNTGDPLKFLEVVKGEKQLVNGTMYYLQISAEQNGNKKLFDAVVWVHLPVENKPPELISFQPSPLLGGLTEIKDVKTNKEVQELGKFSVEEYNRKNNTDSPLTFLEVVEAQQQVVAGIKYYLKIKAKQNGTVSLFDAVVLVPPVEQKPKELISFKPSQVVIPGGKIEIIDVKTNNEVQELGKFSVEEFNQNYNIYGPLTFSEVILAQYQVVAGLQYYLKISAEQSGIQKLFDAVVFLPPGSKSKGLVSFTPSTN